MLSQKTLGHRRHEQALPHLLGTQIGMLMLHMVALGQDRSRDRPVSGLSGSPDTQQE